MASAPAGSYARPAKMESERKLEVTPTVGYRLGGTTSTVYSDFIESLEVAPALSFGMTLEYALRRNLTLEFIWSHQDNELKLNWRQAPPSGYSTRLTHLNVDTFQIGGLWMFGLGGDKIRPYLDFLLGVSVLTPAPQFSTLTRFSGSIGGGAKYSLFYAMGARLGLRFMPIYLKLHEQRLRLLRPLVRLLHLLRLELRQPVGFLHRADVPVLSGPGARPSESAASGGSARARERRGRTRGYARPSKVTCG